MKHLLFVAVLLLNIVFVVVSSTSCDAESSTICRLSNSSLACCHVKDATCCESGDFCCPHGFQCDLKNSRCTKDDMYIPFYLKMDLLNELLKVGKDQLCPDNQTVCKEKQTCCNMTTGAYGCCPIDHAHCCEDGVHCCPKNYKCNPNQGKCDRESNADVFSPEFIDWFKKEHGSKVSATCPDGKSECPSGATCCQLASGQYGCCPLPNAVCCEDHIHCCPNGYVCDVKDGRCNKQDEKDFVALVKKIPAFKPARTENTHVRDNEYSVVCPDGCSFCPNENTCCRLADGTYGCCPLPKAVCCQDHLHCCPQNTKCNMKAQTCESHTESLPWYEKVPAKSRLDVDNSAKTRNDPVLCGDGKTQCDPLKVCCKLPDSSYGCCSYVDGVCCPGQSFCCPSNTVCGSEPGECLPKKAEQATKWFELSKNSVMSWCGEAKGDNKENTCAKNMTSCQDGQGQLVCCWYENGVCCGKSGLCCPHGYTCDEANEACQLNDDEIDVSQPQKPSTKIGLCPRRSSQQTDSTKCRFGCCPLKNAVCCSDGLNCCPSGYSCSTNVDSDPVCVKN